VGIQIPYEREGDMADDKQKDSALKPIATIKKTVIAADKKEATKTEATKTEAKVETKKAATKKATAKKAPAKKAEAKTETKKEAATKPAAKTETKAAAKKPAAKKTAAKKPATKTAAKTTTKTAAKKAPAKKETAAKSTVKPSIFLQYGGNDVAYDTLVQNAKNVFQYDMGGKVSDIKDLAVYVKPEEGKAYFVINGSIEGNFNL